MKKVLSILLVICILFTSINPVFADSGKNSIVVPQVSVELQKLKDVMKNIDMEHVNSDLNAKAVYEKLNHLLNNNMSYEQIEKSVKEMKEYETLHEQASKNMNVEGMVADHINTDEFRSFEKRINKLANEYYDYYKKHGELPTIVDKTSSNEQLNTNSLTGAEAVYVFSLMGYYKTEADVALLLTEIAILAGLAEALPVILLVAIVAGIVIIVDWASDVIVESLFTNVEPVSKKISNSFSSTAGNAATNSISTSVSIRRNNNIRHYIAFLNNNPPGGIWVGSPVTFSVAVQTIKASNGANIYSPFNFVDAYNVALGASTGSAPVFDLAHTQNGRMPANLPHYHATAFYVRLNSHSFY